jgi:hypothetical protein
MATDASSRSFPEFDLCLVFRETQKSMYQSASPNASQKTRAKGGRRAQERFLSTAKPFLSTPQADEGRGARDNTSSWLKQILAHATEDLVVVKLG